MSDLLNEFREIKPKYERLSTNVSSVLKEMLKEREIPIFTVEARVKDEESFINKVLGSLTPLHSTRLKTFLGLE